MTLKKTDTSYETPDSIAYLYDTLANYNAERAIEVPYSGIVKEYLSGTDK